MTAAVDRRLQDCSRPALAVRFSWPEAPGPRDPDNFFLGIWHPERALQVQFGGAAPPAHAIRRGPNWALACATTGFAGEPRGLIHVSEDGHSALAFRGYVCDPPLHSYSPSADLLRYWKDRRQARHNGVFSAALIDRTAGSLTLIADGLGFAPLYYRLLHGAVLFATNPRYLAVPGDEPDLLAWRGLIESNFIASDRSLSLHVRRLPAGQQLQASGTKVQVLPWLDLRQLAGGERRLDNDGMAEIENTFQQAMARCLELADLQVLLPLSSGHDSRRMLASLLHRGTEFKALTAQVFHKRRDLDAHFASEMAREFRFDHQVVPATTPRQYLEQDRVRRIQTDAESGMHSWVPGLMRALPGHPAMVLDGIAGDILGNPGFRLPAMYQSPAQDVDIIVAASLPGAFDRVLRESPWPTPEAVRDDLRSYLAILPQGINLAEFAFILLRQRRTTAPWSEQMLPPGYVPVCPFLDLEYVRLLLSFLPADKHATVVQRRCLADFWPQFYRFPGTRDIPPGTTQRPASVDAESIHLCSRALYEEIAAGAGLAQLRDYLSGAGRLALLGTRLNRRLAVRENWRVQTLMELVSRAVSRRDSGWHLSSPDE